MPRKAQAPRYSAPALEKGLDILELLSARGQGLSQRDIARELERTPGEIFRMLACLERREYVRRGAGERYRLTSRLFELAHQHPPTQRLLETALPEMRALAERAEQSCHLAIRDGDGALIVANVQSPGFSGFSVRAGARIPLEDSCSGRVLIAFDAAAEAPGRALETRLRRIRKLGYEQTPSPWMKGITDIGFPVLDPSGVAVASLTVPCLPQLGRHPGVDEVCELLGSSADRITGALGGPPRETAA